MLPAVVTGLLFFGGSAAQADADSYDPKKDPKTQGPLSLEDTACNGRDVRSDRGDLLGRAEVCVYLYDFDSLSETDLLTDHGAAWLQARFTPSDGWCATGLTSRLEIEGGTMENVSKARSRKGRTVVAMPVTAGGSALEEGKISQSWTQRGGIAHSNVVRTEDPAIKTIWDGRSAGPVSVAGGIAYSYDILSSARQISYGFSELTLATC